MRLEQGVSSSHATSEGLALGRGCEVASSMEHWWPEPKWWRATWKARKLWSMAMAWFVEAYLHPICNLDISIVIVVVSL